jgi:hypothetical protein
VRNADLPGEWSLSTTPSPKPHGPRSTGARAERRRRVWLGLTSGQRISNLYQGGWNAITRMVAAYHPLPKTTWPAVDRCARRAP